MLAVIGGQNIPFVRMPVAENAGNSNNRGEIECFLNSPDCIDCPGWEKFHRSTWHGAEIC